MPAPKDPVKRAAWIEKNRQSHTGKKDSEKTLEKKRVAHLGIEPWNKGIPSTPEACENQSKALKGKPKSQRSKNHCKKISDRNSGEGNPMFGQKHTLDALKKIHIAQLGNKKNLGHHLPLASRKKMSEDRQGEKSHTWKGGVTPMRKMIRESFEYREWIKKVFMRDLFTCKECNQHGGYLHAHHIKSFSQILEENNITNLEKAKNCRCLWNVNNGITLCKKCHKKKHFS
jgi:hypothetical protein